MQAADIEACLRAADEVGRREQAEEEEEGSTVSSASATSASACPAVLSCSFGRVRIKHRPLDTHTPCTHRAEEVHVLTSQVDRLHTPVQRAATGSSASTVSVCAPPALSSLRHEFHVLHHLHSHGVRCVPPFAALLTSASCELLVQTELTAPVWQSIRDLSRVAPSPLPASSSQPQQPPPSVPTASPSSASSLPLLLSERWCRRLTSALHSLHAAGVVHLDLKPEHIWLRKGREEEQEEARQAGAEEPARKNEEEGEEGSICFIDFDLATLINKSSPVTQITPPPHAASAAVSATVPAVPPVSSSIVETSSAAPPALFRGTVSYASLLTHLGCPPSPCMDVESLLYVLLEACIRQRFAGQEEWRWKWDRQPKQMEALEDTIGGQDPEALFSHLFRWMEAQSFSWRRIHRAAKDKLDLLVGADDPTAASSLINSSVSTTDHFLHRCFTRIRAPLLSLLQLVGSSQEVEASSLLLTEILSTLRSRWQKTTDSPLSAPSPPMVPLGISWEQILPSLSATARPRLLTRSLLSAYSQVHPLTTITTWDGATASHSRGKASDLLLLQHDGCLYFPLDPSATHGLLSFVLASPSTSCLAGVRQTSSDAVCADHLKQDADEYLQQQHPRFCQQLTLLEREFRRRFPGEATAFDATHLLTASPCALLVRPPRGYTLTVIDTFFAALLRSAFLLTLPYVHLSILLSRFALLLPESALSTTEEPAAHTGVGQERGKEEVAAGACLLSALLAGGKRQLTESERDSSSATLDPASPPSKKQRGGKRQSQAVREEEHDSGSFASSSPSHKKQHPLS